MTQKPLSPVRLVLKVTPFLLLHCTVVFLCFWGVLTRLDTEASAAGRSGNARALRKQSKCGVIVQSRQWRREKLTDVRNMAKHECFGPYFGMLRKMNVSGRNSGRLSYGTCNTTCLKGGL